eukprot:4496650-Heterocapsa_arctica.AAC.1
MPRTSAGRGKPGARQNSRRSGGPGGVRRARSKREGAAPRMKARPHRPTTPTPRTAPSHLRWSGS